MSCLKSQNLHPACIKYDRICICKESYIDETERNVEIQWKDHSNINKTSEPSRHLNSNSTHRLVTWYKIIKSCKTWKKLRNRIKGYKIELSVIKSYKIQSLVLDKNQTVLFIIKFNFFSLFIYCTLFIAVKVLILVLHYLLSVFWSHSQM